MKLSSEARVGQVEVFWRVGRCRPSAPCQSHEHRWRACDCENPRSNACLSVENYVPSVYSSARFYTAYTQRAAGRARCDMPWQLLARAELRSSCHGPCASWPLPWHRRSSRIEGEVTATHRYLTSWRTQPSVPPKAAAELCFMALRRTSLLGPRQHRV